MPGTACSVDTECLASCGQQPFPPIGTSAFIPVCSQGSCLCHPYLIDAGAKRVACPSDSAASLICPSGTNVACTPGTCTGSVCPPVATCLSAPAYGGECLTDLECSQASCPSDTQPFCGSDSHCKCRGSKSGAINCSTNAECASVGCGSGEISACVSGLCACAKPGPAVNNCKSVSDCSSDCPTGYVPACDKNSCVCQKKAIVPVQCKTVDDCTGVNCPAGYDKACRDSLCECTKQIEIKP
jgi:hypothetical protein